MFILGTSWKKIWNKMWVMNLNRLSTKLGQKLSFEVLQSQLVLNLHKLYSTNCIKRLCEYPVYIKNYIYQFQRYYSFKNSLFCNDILKQIAYFKWLNVFEYFTYIKWTSISINSETKRNNYDIFYIQHSNLINFAINSLRIFIYYTWLNLGQSRSGNTT